MTILGTVEIRDFDKGVIEAFGGELVEYVVDGSTRRAYAVEVPGITTNISLLDGKVPIYWSDPEEAYRQYKKPSFIVTRNDFTVAFDRKPWYGWVARGPSDDATKVTLPSGRVGYTKYDNQWRGDPFDITYDVKINTELRVEAARMHKHFFRHCRPLWWGLSVVDSKGDIREYDSGDFNISNSTEIAGFANRTAGYTISFTVRAELDHVDDMEAQAVLGVERSMYNYDPL